MEKVVVITRVSPPSHLDKLEYGTLCIVQEGLDKLTSYYGQLSHNSEDPRWQLLELPSQDACLKFLKDASFTSSEG